MTPLLGVFAFPPRLSVLLGVFAFSLRLGVLLVAFFYNELNLFAT